MGMIEQAYHGLFVVTVLILALLVICSVLRSVAGPRTADRIIAINMAGTMIIMIIAVLSVMLDQNYLVDICLIYAMISFLGVVVLCKIYTGVYLQKKNRKATLAAIAENIHEQSEQSPAAKETKLAKEMDSVKETNLVKEIDSVKETNLVKEIDSAKETNSVKEKAVRRKNGKGRGKKHGI